MSGTRETWDPGTATGTLSKPSCCRDPYRIYANMYIFHCCYFMLVRLTWDIATRSCSYSICVGPLDRETPQKPNLIPECKFLFLLVFAVSPSTGCRNCVLLFQILPLHICCLSQCWRLGVNILGSLVPKFVLMSLSLFRLRCGANREELLQCNTSARE